ncbi:MAG: hypothetical protein BWY10_01044 [Chloroflexi bacterium ADurb.Bin180]|nr:MAG: hypothetical protein BWY10_01044 [Chloroflexi bacterium ADurb.Bin180]
MNKPLPESQLQGACGLYCGLCPRYQSSSPSRCPGCQLGEQHSYCSVWRCAVHTKGLLTCAKCAEYPCAKLKLCIGEGADSFLSHQPAFPNLERIRANGLESHLAEARERRELLEELLARYNDGRSMSFYCVAAALLSPERLRQALQKVDGTVSQGRVNKEDLKARARAMRSTLQEYATQDGISLALRKGKAGDGP